MIKAELKPIDEILTCLDPYNKILLVGCGACVTVCHAGGEKEVGLLASGLRMARKKMGKMIEVEEATTARQCEPEFALEVAGTVEKVEAILSIACGVGVQFLAGRYSDIPVFPGLNTAFMGGAVGQGVWSERCQGCGTCILHLTGGICPITRCSKSILNGPCGGAVDGKCEINPEIECGWQLIINRLKELGEFERRFTEIIPVKDWSTSRDGGPRTVVREDLR